MKERHHHPNTIRLDLKNEQKDILRRAVIESIARQFKVKRKMIKYVSTPYNHKSWIMTFDESFDVKKIIGSIIRIGNESVQAEDYNSVPQKFRLTFATYKIIWLNHAQDLNKIKNMILDLFGARNNEVRIVKCYEEIYKDLDGIFDDDDVEGEIKTGNIIFSISHKEEYRAREIKGQHTFEGKKIKIIKKCAMGAKRLDIL
jgi:hypothetical protein